VPGEAVVKVTPDQVTILLGIETWNKDIQTDHLSIEPRYKSSFSKYEIIPLVFESQKG